MLQGNVLRKLAVTAKTMVAEVEWGVSMTAEHARAAHELGRCHAVQVGVVAAHRVGQRMGAHSTHTHASSKTIGSAINSRREESANSTAFLLGLGGQFPVTGLNIFLLQGSWPGHIVQFVIKTTSITHGLAVCVPSP